MLALKDFEKLHANSEFKNLKFPKNYSTGILLFVGAKYL